MESGRRRATEREAAALGREASRQQRAMGEDRFVACRGDYLPKYLWSRSYTGRRCRRPGKVKLQRDRGRRTRSSPLFAATGAFLSSVLSRNKRFARDSNGVIRSSLCPPEEENRSAIKRPPNWTNARTSSYRRSSH